MKLFSPKLQQLLNHPRPTSRYMAEVDGLRFLAILLVVLFHIYGYWAHFSSEVESLPHILKLVFRHGSKGVYLFFVISGFVVSLPFARHYLNGERKPRLKDYYVKRLVRIEPPFVVAVLLLSVAAFLIKPETVSWQHLAATLTYTHNIIYQAPSTIFEGAWTLEVEIQFYLMAPLFFLIFKLPSVMRYCIWMIPVLALPFALIWWSFSFICIFNYAHYFFLGMLLCDLYVSSVRNTSWAGWNVFTRTGFLLVLVFACINVFFLYQIPFLLISFGLFWLTLKNQTLRGVFGNRWIAFLGSMCYSIYLMHYAIISFLGQLLINWLWFLPQRMMIGVASTLMLMAIVMLCGLYYLVVERPFQDLAKRLTNKAKQQ